MSDLFNTRQAAARCNLSPRTLEKLRVSGDGPVFIRLPRRAVRYRLEDLDSWIQEHCRRSTSDDEPKELDLAKGSNRRRTTSGATPKDPNTVSNQPPTTSDEEIRH